MERILEVQEMMSVEEYQEWRNHPTTLKIIRFLQKTREEYQRLLCQGATLTRNSCEQTALTTCELLGKIYGIALLLDLKVEPPEEEDK